MSHPGSHSEPEGLAVRKRRATNARIAASAARLAGLHGVASTTVEQIAADAEVARATFFRYYDTKESAVAEGITGPWLTLVAEAIAHQPDHLSAQETLVVAFAELADEFPAHHDQIRELARLTRSSATLSAWTAQTYQRYEHAIAELLTPRFSALTERDPRPRLLAALAMTAVRISLDDWLDHGGALPDLIRRALDSISIDPR
ncbi:AcrR family transcriptional regulator [Kibdelosporangium banguiense]|uniref:AcrR family transcriptional regulator n=1 Tax=Kibdelosporangium banguiense TaxID=1365924 RepID=A0ABS4TTQ6_9PSEU|nr:TetR family transcriptional regulator [Kibdelosporangium banguiense]MBP2327786.1 AcrR family transcriptional regulator [Kibdelosporangium banguiense]